jgi:uncharacterized protein Smg (DUF494 family)
MKDNFFELLYHLFEQTLSQIQEEQTVIKQEKPYLPENHLLTLAEIPPESKAIRILSDMERLKLSKSSYQFLMRLKAWGILNEQSFELLLDKLHYTNSHIVTLQEIKWMTRELLVEHLTPLQLSFLDLVLYQTEDGYLAH